MMKMIEIPDIRALGEMMIRVSNKEKLSLTAVVFFDEAEKLLRFFMHKNRFRASYIELMQPDYGYDKEYYVTLWDDGMLTIEPAYDSKGKYYTRVCCVDALFFDGDAKSKIALMHPCIPQFELIVNRQQNEIETDPKSISIIDNVDYINYMFPITRD